MFEFPRHKHIRIFMSTTLALIRNLEISDKKNKVFAPSYNELLKKHKALENKFEKLFAQHEDLKTTKKDLTKTKNYLVQRVKELKESRDNWKQKSIIKSEEVKVLSSKIKPARHHYDLNIIELAVFLRIEGKLSYRSIPRVLSILKRVFSLPLDIPCANTIQNWVAKAGHHHLYGDSTDQMKGSVNLITDESIQIGGRKVLLALLTPSQKNRDEALSFSDVEVAYIGFSKNWTGEKIAEVISSEVMREDININYSLSDEGNNLKKASRLLELPHVADISHAVATCLRRVYKKNTDYQSFMKQISAYVRGGVNKSFSYLLPPKIRNKARFMNQHGIVNWAKALLNGYETLNDEEKEFFKDLSLHTSVIDSLDHCLQMAQQIALHLKEEGFNAYSYKLCKDILKTGQSIDNQCEIFSQELEKYIEGYQESLANLSFLPGIELQETDGEINTELPPVLPKILGYNVCSDVIESLFGKYKSITSNNSWVEASAIALELPLYTSTSEKIKANLKEAMEDVLLYEIKKWKDRNTPDNQMIKRQRFFKNEKKKS